MKKKNPFQDDTDSLPKPLDATSVATKMGVLPLRKSEKCAMCTLLSKFKCVALET